MRDSSVSVILCRRINVFNFSANCDIVCFMSLSALCCKPIDHSKYSLTKQLLQCKLSSLGPFCINFGQDRFCAVRKLLCFLRVIFFYNFTLKALL